MCDWWNVKCHVSDGVESLMGDAIENMATAVLEAVGKGVASLGTLWINVGTPNLTAGNSGTSSQLPGAYSAQVLTILNYITWFGLAIAIISIISLGSMIALRMRRGDGLMSVGKIGVVLTGVILISGASSIVAGLLPSGPGATGGAVAFLHGSLWWLMLAVAVGGVVVGGARMAFEQRAAPGKEVVMGLLWLMGVAAAGVTIVGLLIAAMDGFSVWILTASLTCDVQTPDGACFGGNMLALLSLTAGSGGLGPLLVIVLGIIAILCSLFQMVLMIARSGMLVILTGILPLSAAASISGEAGKGWLKKNISWLIAFILYKPAAAVIYAAAFQLAGTNVFKDDGTGLISVLTGVMMMILALFAMPALMRFITPMVGSMAAGAGGGALAAGALAALPSGASALGRLASGSGGSSDQGSQASPGPSGSDGSAGSPGGSGNSESSGSPAATPTEPVGGGAAASSGGAGATGGGATAGGAAGGVTGGAAAGGAAGGVTGGAAAGAAGGPVGIAAGAALSAVKPVADAASAAIQDIGDQSTGEGPSGS